MTDGFIARTPRILTPEQRKARNAERRADAQNALREHEAAQKAFYENRERLKAQRLMRETQHERRPKNMSPRTSRDLPGPPPRKDKARDVREAVVEDADKTEGADRDLEHGDGGSLNLSGKPDYLDNDD
jgi:hypothetical protein